VGEKVGRKPFRKTQQNPEAKWRLWVTKAEMRRYLAIEDAVEALCDEADRNRLSSSELHARAGDLTAEKARIINRANSRAMHYQKTQLRKQSQASQDTR
jgi:hypothetical protein